MQALRRPAEVELFSQDEEVKQLSRTQAKFPFHARKLYSKGIIVATHKYWTHDAARTIMLIEGSSRRK